MEGSKQTSKCYICEQEFSPCNLQAHFLECDQEHKCEICDKVFQTENQLENHKAAHEEMIDDYLKIQHTDTIYEYHKCV